MIIQEQKNQIPCPRCHTMVPKKVRGKLVRKPFRNPPNSADEKEGLCDQCRVDLNIYYPPGKSPLDCTRQAPEWAGKYDYHGNGPVSDKILPFHHIVLPAHLVADEMEARSKHAAARFAASNKSSPQ